MIVDPGIHKEPGYSPYDDAMALDIFIKSANTNVPLINLVWPGYVAFPDFNNPLTYDFWLKYLTQFHQTGKIK